MIIETMYVYYCRTYEKAVSGGGEREKGGHVLRDTTSKQRLSAGRARDHPVMEIVPNKALSLSLSLSLSQPRPVCLEGALSSLTR